jgi:mannose-6-phosphate isomerase-like protein (cupin superfamily)
MLNGMCGVVAIALLCLTSRAAYGQTVSTPTAATDLSGSAIQAHIRTAEQQGVTDRILSMVDIGPYNIAAAVVIRRPPSPTSKGVGNIGGFLSHNKITEVYYVLRGSGTQLTGGTMIGGQPNKGGGATGPGIGGGTSLRSARSSNLVAGDIQIIPPNVPHGWASVGPEGIDYIVFRVDPDHVLVQK